ncbi:Endophilin-B1 isoform 1 [Schistosoma japonicum]|uniref:Endophilin-B1 isoform 1 n=2 Tax=Schistosoma japonicum TaxID=6182 RepID=A0A4Z2CY91_SCHJA|nr:Endophilin-B1 [Schistosoma japonicum]TNN09207.1 Endophilin-B1 isoform 1 [Schistosoma japonicum]
MKKFMDSTNTKFNRAIQKTSEIIGRAEKTEFDDDFVALLKDAESTHEASKHIMEAIELWINPCVLRKFDDVACKVESMVTDNKSYWLKVPAKLPAEHLGDTLVNAAMDVGVNTQYGSALKHCGEYGREIAEIESRRNSVLEKNTLYPLHRFLAIEWPDIQKERSHLESVRLDYDQLRSKVKHNDSSDPETGKKLENAKDILYKQLEVTRSKLQLVKSVNQTNLVAIKELVAAQRNYFNECKQKTEELASHLEGLR